MPTATDMTTESDLWVAIESADDDGFPLGTQFLGTNGEQIWQPDEAVIWDDAGEHVSTGPR
jgi:hypothetical protein